MTSKYFSWMSNPQYLAQVGHFFGALSLIFIIGSFGGRHWAFGSYTVGLVLAGSKEFIVDTAPWGEGDSWSDSVMDFTFYVLGGTLALALLVLGVNVLHATWSYPNCIDQDIPRPAVTFLLARLKDLCQTSEVQMIRIASAAVAFPESLSLSMRGYLCSVAAFGRIQTHRKPTSKNSRPEVGDR